MKVKVKFLSILREVFGGEEKEIKLKNKANIQDLLDNLCDTSQRRQTIFSDSSEPKAYIHILKNGKPIQSLDGIHTKLEEDDIVTIIRPLGGG